MAQNRPIVRIARRPLDWVLEGICLIGLILLLVIPSVRFVDLPETIPVHFSATGEPDGWGSRTTIFLLPGVGLVLYGLLTFVGRKPHRYNYLWSITEENATRQYALAMRMMVLLKCEVVWLQTLLALLMVRTAEGDRDGLGVYWLPAIMVALLGTMVWYFVRAKQLR